MRRNVRVAVGTVAVAGSAACLWEGYKAIGNPDGTILFGVRLLPRTDDAAMPHLWDVLARFGQLEPATGRPVGLVLDHRVSPAGDPRLDGTVGRHRERGWQACPTCPARPGLRHSFLVGRARLEVVLNPGGE